MRLVARLVFLAIGLVLAIPAGAVVLLIGIAYEPAAQELIAHVGTAAFDALLTEAYSDGMPHLVMDDLLIGFWMLSGLLLVGPPSVTALAGEVIGTRSYVFYGAVCAILTAALPWLLRADLSMTPALGAEARLSGLLFLTGAAAGLTYWAVSGRSAGREPVSAPSA